MWYERGSPWESLALAFPSYITPRLPVIINITNYFYIKWGTKKVQMLIMLGEEIIHLIFVDIILFIWIGDLSLVIFIYWLSVPESLLY